MKKQIITPVNLPEKSSNKVTIGDCTIIEQYNTKSAEELIYHKFYEKSANYYSSQKEFEKEKCDLCSYTIYNSNEICYFDSPENLKNYLIYLLITKGKVVLSPNSNNNLDNLIQELKDFHPADSIKPAQKKTSLCKFCLLKLINSQSLVELIKSIFLPKDSSNKKKHIQQNNQSNFLNEHHLSNLVSASQKLFFNFFSLCKEISQYYQARIEEKIALFAVIKKTFQECKMLLEELNKIFSEVMGRISALSSRFLEENESKEIREEIKNYRNESVVLCESLNTYTSIFNTLSNFCFSNFG